MLTAFHLTGPFGTHEHLKFDGNDYRFFPKAAPGSASSAARVNERSLEIAGQIHDGIPRIPGR